MEKEQARGSRVTWMVLWFMVLGIIVFLRFAPEARLREINGRGLLAMILVALVAGFFVWKLIRFSRRSAKIRGLLNEEGTWSLARRCAGEDGTVVRDGPLTIWYSGPEDPVPMLREEIAAVHRRFETLLGETDIVDPPIRVIGFHDRDAPEVLPGAAFPGTDLACIRASISSGPGAS